VVFNSLLSPVSEAGSLSSTQPAHLFASTPYFEPPRAESNQPNELPEDNADGGQRGQEYSQQGEYKDTKAGI
jgi:hypothetical protein